MFKLRHLNNLYFYSLGRHALSEAFRIASLKRGERVLLPRLVCKDLLECLYEFGATPIYYDVTKINLRPILTQTLVSSSRLILSINYFGFAQELSQFHEYALKGPMSLIEDNAHGYLSKDEAGNYLGVRSDFGIFSPRKTLLMPNGAMLYVNSKGADKGLSPDQPASVSMDLKYRQRLKKLLRKSGRIGQILLSLALSIKSAIERYRMGSQQGSEGLSHLQTPSNPWSGLRESLEAMNEERESARRRRLYINFELELNNLGYLSVFDKLPKGCVPYGFPFYADNNCLGLAVRAARAHGFDVMKWPDLPEAAGIPNSHFYRNLYLINFQI
jgi:hypothetical protein